MNLHGTSAHWINTTAWILPLLGFGLSSLLMNRDLRKRARSRGITVQELARTDPRDYFRSLLWAIALSFLILLVLLMIGSLVYAIIRSRSA